MKTKFVVFGVALAIAVFTGSAAGSTLDDPKMAGRWVGTADIVVDWTAQRTLRVELDIAADGVVTGQVGDAKLSAGRIEQNRGLLARALGKKTDYLISGPLAGAVIAAEGVRRDAVKIPLKWSGDSFVGGLHTSGSLFGGKEKMILSATHLTLEKEAPAK